MATPINIPGQSQNSAGASNERANNLSKSAPSSAFTFTSPMLLNLMLNTSQRTTSHAKERSIDSVAQSASSATSSSPPVTPKDWQTSNSALPPLSPQQSLPEGFPFAKELPKYERRFSVGAGNPNEEAMSPRSVMGWLSRLPGGAPLTSPTSPKDSYNFFARFSGNKVPTLNTPTSPSGQGVSQNPNNETAPTLNTEERGRGTGRRPSIVRKLTPMSREVISPSFAHQF